MAEKCLIPCAIEEAIRVDISSPNLGHRTFTFNFPVRICTNSSKGETGGGKDDSETKEIDVWIDSSGSLSIEKQKKISEIAIANDMTPKLNSSERWINWALISHQEGRSCFLFINESSPYKQSSEKMYSDLADYGSASPHFPKPVFLELIIIKDNPESQALEESSDTAFASGIFSRVNAKKRSIPAPDDDLIKKILKEKNNFIEITRINGWAKPLIDALKIIFPFNNLNSLLDEDLFQLKIFSYRSTERINVSIKCGNENNCPEGYCEIPSDEYPFYCCVKF